MGIPALRDGTAPPARHASAPSHAAASEPSIRHATWLREMERAQTADWLLTGSAEHARGNNASSRSQGDDQPSSGRNGEIDTSITTSSAGLPLSGTKGGAHGHLHLPQSEHVGMATGTANSMPSRLADAGTSHRAPIESALLNLPEPTEQLLSRYHEGASIKPTSAGDGVTEDMRGSCPAKSTSRTAGRAEPESTSARLPMRLHLQFDGSHADAWLGLDADRLPQIEALLRELTSSLRAEGRQLRRLVCNGVEHDLRALDRSPAPPPLPASDFLTKDLDHGNHR